MAGWDSDPGALDSNLDRGAVTRTLLALPVLLATGITFASLALVFNAKASGYDFFTYYFAVFLSPMMFLSGVFFPREQLPAFAQAITDWLPLTAAVELVRPLFLNQWPAQPWRHAAVHWHTARAPSCPHPGARPARCARWRSRPGSRCRCAASR